MEQVLNMKPHKNRIFANISYMNLFFHTMSFLEAALTVIRAYKLVIFARC